MKNRSKKRNIFWGVLLLLGACALIVGKLGYLEGIGFWTILFSLGLIGLFIDGIYHRSWGMCLFSLAFLGIVNDKLLGIEAVTPWPLLGAALLGTVGLNLLLPGKNYRKYIHTGGGEDWGECSYQESADPAGGHCISIEASFNSTVKYISSTDLSQVRIENSFCTMSLYLDNAALHNGSAYVNLETSFGTTELYVPADWKVILNVKTAFGHAAEAGVCSPAGNNVLQVTGNVSFGELRVHYI